MLGLALVLRFAWFAWQGLLHVDRYLVGVQLGVLMGAGLHVGHYWLLRRAAGLLHQPDQLLTDRALYRWIRHPMYLGDLMVAICLAILLEPLDWLLAGACAVAIVAQCAVEDRLMARSFGAQFDAWSQSSWRLIPYVW